VTAEQDGALFDYPPEAKLRLIAAELTRPLMDRIEKIERRLQSLGVSPDEEPGYQPEASPHWWVWLSEDQLALMKPGDREAAIAECEDRIRRLEDWVEQVYKPSVGHLGTRLLQCWPKHQLCLNVLDLLCQQHTVLYLQPERIPGLVGAQANWWQQLPDFAELMANDFPSACSLHSADFSPHAKLAAVGAGISR
jgi:hypothetical protein